MAIGMLSVTGQRVWEEWRAGGDGGLRRRQVDGVQRVGGVEEEEG